MRENNKARYGPLFLQLLLNKKSDTLNQILCALSSIFCYRLAYTVRTFMSCQPDPTLARSINSFQPFSSARDNRPRLLSVCSLQHPFPFTSVLLNIGSLGLRSPLPHFTSASVSFSVRFLQLTFAFNYIIPTGLSIACLSRFRRYRLPAQSPRRHQCLLRTKLS